ncbi:MAG TPA: aquaporin [Lacisediminihabitans sp.]|uniref:aquaporin n=1 Tax=Lacisediminihabitans sp. TaxID=2787631 RepID=UPI002EDA4F53
MTEIRVTTHTLFSRLVAEAFGTFLLVFGIVGTALFTSGNTGILGVALAAGLAVAAGAFVFGPVSGAHFNPAVTLAAAAAGRIRWREVVPYILAQLVGGIGASSLLFAISAGGPSGYLANVVKGGFASNGYGDHSPAGFTVVAVVLTEFILTTLFVYVVLGLTRGGAPAAVAPLAMGLALTLVYLVAVPVSNASINPARSIATAIYGGPTALGQLWVFILVPILGALVAGFSYRALFDRAPLAGGDAD